MLMNMLKRFTGFGVTKMVFIVRTDLNMGRGKIAAQVAHAAVSLYESSLECSNPHLKNWMRYGQPKVVLKVDQNGEQTLHDVYNSAVNSKMTACLIRDAGKTQISTGTVTVVGIGPQKIEDVDKLTRAFKLL